MEKEKLFRFFREEKHLLLFTAALLALASAIAVAVFVPAADPVDAEPDENSLIYYSSNAEASQGTASQEPGNSKIIKNLGEEYTLRLQGNQIAVFESGTDLPIYTLDVELSRLPPADRVLLENGITAETLVEARRLLEDYE